MNKKLINKIRDLHQTNNKSFIEFIQRNKKLFSKNGESGYDAYNTLCNGILPESYLNYNIIMSPIPNKSMKLIRFILSCYTQYIRYIEVNGLGVGSNFSEIELELCNPKHTKDYVTIYIPISFLQYMEYDVSIIKAKNNEYIDTWYVPEKRNIENSLNKVHQKLTEFDRMIGSDI